MTTNNHESTEGAARYAQHVAELCRAFHIRLAIGRHMDPASAGAGFVEGRPDKKVIQIAAVIDDSTYAVALHELGHCLHPLGMLHDQGSISLRVRNVQTTKRDVRLKLMEERAAWEWARHYAIEWTETMTFVERISLESYVTHASRVLGKEM